MGMDLGIYRARNHEVFKHDGWWDNPNVEQVFYGRKAWHYPNHCDFIPKDYENGDFFEISVENVENMIEVACHYRNYFDTYDDIPQLCELRDRMIEEEEEESSYKYFIEWDW